MSRFESSRLAEEFLRKKQNYLPDKPLTFLAGISGGPDSMALLYILHRLGIDTIAVHCNYQLRGEASDKDQELVEEICSLWKINCISARLDPSENQGNFQAWARDRRYEIFRELKTEHNADYILTAHHEEDQIETILQKVLRGAGMVAWKGMDILDGDLFRPLLCVSKDSIMQFVEAFNVPYRIDRTNEESTYARNFLRNNWFPALDNLFPGWKKNLMNIPIRSSEFESMANYILEGIRKDINEIDRKRFLKLDSHLQKVIFHHFTSQIVSDLAVSRSFLTSIDKLSSLQSGKTLAISEKHVVMRDRDSFKILAGEAEFSGLTEVTPEMIRKGEKVRFMQFTFESKPDKFEEKKLYLDEGKLLYPLSVRKWKNGDSFTPLGMEGGQLVSDHLTNRKISSAVKREAEVLLTFDGRICAVIFPEKSGTEQPGTISDKFRCSPSTKKTLTIFKL